MEEHSITELLEGKRRAPLMPVLLLLPVQMLLYALLLENIEPLVALERATGGLIDINLPGGLLGFALSLGPLALVWGGLSLVDIGLDRAKLRTGLVVTFVLWLVAQSIILLDATLPAAAPELHPIWERPLRAIGFLTAMLVVMPLLEEASFRGFLLPQIYLNSRGTETVRLVMAVLLSAVMFALVHLPNRLILHDLGGRVLLLDMAQLTAGGIFFAVAYLRTRNLWVVGGLHALDNAPTPLFESTFHPVGVYLVLAALLLLGWPLIEQALDSGSAEEAVPEAGPAV